jgi:hypothetical protein
MKAHKSLPENGGFIKAPAENGDFSPAKIGVYFSVYPKKSRKTSRPAAKFSTNFTPEIWLPENGKPPFLRPLGDV